MHIGNYVWSLTDKKKKKAVVIDVAIPRDGNIRKKEEEKLEKFQRGRKRKVVESEGNSGTSGNQRTL